MEDMGWDIDGSGAYGWPHMNNSGLYIMPTVRGVMRSIDVNCDSRLVELNLCR